jgi:selenocysteine lyase/cysteine desulfurase
MSATPQVKPQAQQHAKEHGKESRRVTAPATVVFDAERVREDFPALHQLIGKHPLVYLDNAATALKPQSVIDAVSSVYAVDCANIHRGVHTLSQRATQRYEDARDKARRFLNAPSVEETIFVRGTTEGINLVAQCYARPRLREGDEILITELEHHSNIVPWQMVALATGAKLVVAPVNDAGEVTEDAFSSKLSTRTKMVSFAHVSNALGTILPAKRFVQLAKSVGAAVCIDGAQAAPHAAVDVQDLGCDFYAFSGHKVYGPTGIGVLYGRRELLEEMIPYQGGGDMIDRVTFAETTWNALPYKFEAGTPHIAGRHRPRRGARLPDRARPRTRSRHTSVTCWPMAPLSSRPSRVCGWWAPPRTRWACCRSSWRARTRATWAPSSTRWAWPCERGTTARSRSWTASASPPRRARRWRSTAPAPTSTRWCAACTSFGRCSHE